MLFSSFVAALAVASLPIAESMQLPRGVRKTHFGQAIVSTDADDVSTFASAGASDPTAPGSVSQELLLHYKMGGTLLTNPVTVYYIYYGNWTAPQKAIVEDFTKGLSSSTWWGTTKNYFYQKNKKSPRIPINGDLKLGATVVDNYTLGKNLTDGALPILIQKYIDTKDLPEDVNGIYTVLISPDVGEGSTGSDFCSSYCGYHYNTMTKSGQIVKYALVGNPLACLDGCGLPQNQNKSPNGDVGVDAMMTTLAHELTETVTDSLPSINPAWGDLEGNENADKCVFRTSAVRKTRNGSSYNVVIGKRKFLLEDNWSWVQQKCVNSE